VTIGTAAKRALRRARLGLWTPEFPVAVVSFIMYTFISLTRYNRYESGVDLAIFGQAVRDYANLQTPDIALKSQLPFNILGDHFSPIIAVIAPFYRAVPHIQVLLIAQAVLLAWGVWLIGRLARRRLGLAWAAPAAAGYAISWGLVSTAAFDFHEVAFAVPLVILAIEASEDGRWRALAVCSVLLVLTKEDSTFLLGGIALLLLARHRIKAGLILGAASVVTFVVLITVIIPAFNVDGQYIYLASVPGAAGGIVSNALTLLHQPAFWQICLLLIAALGPGLRSPIVLVLLPTLVSRLVADYPQYWAVTTHYYATMIAVCAVAAIDGWTHLRRRDPNGPRGTLPTLAVAHLLAALILSLITIQHTYSWSSLFAVAPMPQDAINLAAAVEHVPAGVTIAADTYATPHLVDRDTVYLAKQSWLDSTNHPLNPQWVLLDENSIAENNPTTHWVVPREQTLLSAGYVIVERDGSVVLLRKR
jgi:uncharacterized membrane protein